MFAASAFRNLSSIYVFSYFPFGFEGRIWDLIVSAPDHCLSFLLLIMWQAGIDHLVAQVKTSICLVLSSIRSGINIKAINSPQFMF